MDFYIKSTKFKSDKLHDKNAQNVINFKQINVFVGANNCGKTQIIKDLVKTFGLNCNDEDILLDRNEITFYYPNNFPDFVSSCHLDMTKTSSKFPSYIFKYMSPILGESISNSKYYECSINEDTYKKSFDNESNFTALIRNIGLSLFTYLNTDFRLRLISPFYLGNQLNENSNRQSVYQGILLDKNSDEIIKNVDHWFYKIFHEHTWLTDFSYGGVTFRYKLTKEELSNSSSINVQKEIDSEYKPVDKQGDGMRAVLGILCSIFASQKPIIFIDEPEAYLHPGQAYTLGKCIGEIISDNRQVFISTHSADFLRGLFLSNPSDISITRLYRYDDNTIDYFELSGNKLTKIAKDNVSSAFNILDGLFHPASIVCEGDKDVLIYQHTIDEIDLSSDIHVFPTTGIGGVSKATGLYRTMNIKHAIILDCDSILNNGKSNQKMDCPITNIFNKYEKDQNTRQKLKDLLLQLNSAFTITINPKTGEATGIDPTEREDFKNSLHVFLTSHGIEQCYNEITSLVNKYGIFLTQEGQLEAWLKDEPIINSKFLSTDSKKVRYEKIVDSLYNINDVKILKNTQLGQFVCNVIAFLS